MAQATKTREVVSPPIAPTQPKANTQAATAQAAPERPEGENIDQYNLETLMNDLKSKSNVIRFLRSKGYSRAQVANFMGIRYQHVRNVELMPVGKPRE